MPARWLHDVAYADDMIVVGRHYARPTRTAYYLQARKERRLIVPMLADAIMLRSGRRHARRLARGQHVQNELPGRPMPPAVTILSFSAASAYPRLPRPTSQTP